MASNPPPPPPPPPPPQSGDREKPEDKGATRRDRPGWTRYILWIAVGALLTVMLVNYLTGGDSREEVTYSNFLASVDQGEVEEVTYDNNDGGIVFATALGEFETTGPHTACPTPTTT